ncbi:MAG: baseplate J protein, partial [Aestuariivirga sp.]
MSHDTALDLSVLPPPEVIETVSYEPIVAAMRDDLVARFPAIAGVIDLESEPARKLIEVFAYREILLRARANDVARANLLAFATGADLDHLAAWYDVTRL